MELYNENANLRNLLQIQIDNEKMTDIGSKIADEQSKVEEQEDNQAESVNLKEMVADAKSVIQERIAKKKKEEEENIKQEINPYDQSSYKNIKPKKAFLICGNDDPSDSNLEIQSEQFSLS